MFATHLKQHQELLDSFASLTGHDDDDEAGTAKGIVPTGPGPPDRQPPLPGECWFEKPSVAEMPAGDDSWQQSSKPASPSAVRKLMNQSSNTSIQLVRGNTSTKPVGRRSFLTRSLNHVAFKYFISLTILVNTVTLGLMTQDTVDSRMEDQPVQLGWLESMEVAICVIFTSELMARLFSERKDFWIGTDRRWNIFDSCIVIHSLVDQAEKLTPDLTFARVLRIVRFLRIMRLIRVLRVFTSFRLMTYSLLGSLTHMVWIFLCLFLLLYSFTIFFLSGIAESYQDVDVEIQADMQLYYSSVPRCMLLLFMCVTGGDDWTNFLQPLKAVSAMYVCAFIFYIFFMVFGAVNVVVAAFVETAADVSRRDRDAVIEQQINQTQRIADDIRKFFDSADHDSSGFINRAELREYLQDDTVKASFNALGLDVSQAVDLFDLLDVDDDGMVSQEEFLSGCMRLRGTASSMDLNLLLWEVEKVTWKITSLSRNMDFCIRGVEQLMCTSDLRKPQSQQQFPKKKPLDAWTAERKSSKLFQFMSLQRLASAGGSMTS